MLKCFRWKTERQKTEQWKTERRKTEQQITKGRKPNSEKQVTALLFYVSIDLQSYYNFFTAFTE
jgi:hypothetical protein